MKASFMCSMTYQDSSAHDYSGWPVPPRFFDTDTGQRTYDDFLGWSARADELGFDWVSVSEHHYAPLIIAPSTGVMAGALSQVVRLDRADWRVDVGLGVAAHPQTSSGVLPRNEPAFQPA